MAKGPIAAQFVRSILTWLESSDTGVHGSCTTSAYCIYDNGCAFCFRCRRLTATKRIKLEKEQEGEEEGEDLVLTEEEEEEEPPVVGGYRSSAVPGMGTVTPAAGPYQAPAAVVPPSADVEVADLFRQGATGLAVTTANPNRRRRMHRGAPRPSIMKQNAQSAANPIEISDDEEEAPAEARPAKRGRAHASSRSVGDKGPVSSAQPDMARAVGGDGRGVEDTEARPSKPLVRPSSSWRGWRRLGARRLAS